MKSPGIYFYNGRIDLIGIFISTRNSCPTALILLFLLLACSGKNEPKPSSTIIAIGDANGYPTYWKDGVESRIANSGGMVQCGFVSGSEVYAAGSENVNNVQTPVWWHAGSAVTLSVPPGGYGEVNSLFVNGPDVYAAGKVSDPTNVNVAVYWKNGVMQVLDNTLSSMAMAIALSNNDLYVGGISGTSAAYWKNGVVTKLSSSGSVVSLFVDGTDVFAAGYDNGVACYWKNGTKIVLNPSGSTIGYYITSIFVTGGDVYVGGSQFSFVGTGKPTAVYWKNGSQVTLTIGYMATSVTSAAGVVYTGGYDSYYNRPVYWKGTEMVSLSISATPQNGHIYSIFAE